jgi:flagellin
MVINTNLAAQSAATALDASHSMLAKSLNRLSSGSKLSNPTDDAADIAVAARLDAQVKRLQAARNSVANAVSFTQTQDGYLQKVQKALNRMSELSVLAQDVIKQPQDLSLYDKEFQSLAGYILDLTKKDFNGISLFSGTTLNVITDADPSATNAFSMIGISLATYGTYTSLNSISVSTSTAAATALIAVKNAIAQLSSDRATVGAYQSRLNYTLEQMQMSKENLIAASSRIQDVDVADESTAYARYNVLVQAGTAMLAQANTTAQSVLRLLQ